MKPNQKKPLAKKAARAVKAVRQSPSESALSPAIVVHKKPNRALILLCIVICIVAALIGALVIRSSQNKAEQERQLAADKASFARVETEMASAYSAIVTAVGKPDESKFFKSCSRVSLKYEEGDLWCNTGYSFNFRVDNATQSYAIAQSVQKGILKIDIFTFHSNANLFKDTDLSGNNQKSLDVAFNGPEATSCSLYYEFKNIDALESTYQFSCSRRVAVPVYPLAE